MFYLLSIIACIFNGPVAFADELNKLNLVLISVDSLRLDHMGLYGYKRNTTPHIDRFAQDAVVFNNYFSTSYLTPISEMSVHTGA
jgi:glucan phosphoethanolaminetransferase (alkaline phosphatase superfamily)